MIHDDGKAFYQIQIRTMMTITITVIKIKNETFYTARTILVKKRRIVYDESHKECNKKEVPKNEI